MQEVSFFIYNRCFTIDDIGKFLSLQCVYNLLQGLVFMKLIACIQETQVISCRHSDTFVHGVVKSLVWFTDDIADAFLIFMDHIQRVILRTSIYNDVLHIPIRLEDNALYGIFQDLPCIIGNGYDRELGMKIIHGLQ